MMDWTRTVDPTEEPVSLAEAKERCHVFHADDDVAIAKSIVSARQWVEEYLSRALLTQTWKAVLDDWPLQVWLPRAAPLQSATVQYYAANGTLTTLASTYYTLHTTSEPARFERAANQVWPALQSDRTGRVVITYVAGWTDAESVPYPIHEAMLLLIEKSYYRDTSKDREKDAQSKLASYRLWPRPMVVA